MLRLKIQTHSSINTIEVDPSTRVGAFLMSFVKKLGYPSRDRRGKPLPYHLQLVSAGEKILPYGMSFAELQIPPGSVLVLNIPDTRLSTTPVRKRAALPTGKARPSGWLNRRTFLLASIYTAVSGSGLLLGATTEIIQRAAFAAPRQIQATPPPSKNVTLLPTKAVKQLTFTRHRGPVRTLAWSGDGLTLASGSDDATILIWTPDGSVHRQLPHQAPVRAAAWAADGQRLAVGSGNEVTFWQASTGTMLARSSGPHTGLITSLAWASARQRQVVSGAQDTKAAVWSTENASYQVQTVFTHHTSPIESVAFALDGQSVASSSQGGLTRIWNSTDGRELHGFYQPTQKPVRALRFSPVDPRLAAGDDDGHIRLWDNGLECNQQIQGNFGLECMVPHRDLLAHTKPVRAVAWSPNGKLLASGGEDGLLAIWEPSQSASPLFTVQLPDAVHSLAWGPSSQQIATASGNTVTIWSLQ